jgi:uncharacterized RDD family membrane protein YckC
MAETVQRVNETVSTGTDTVHTTREVQDPVAEREHSKNVASRIIHYITSALLALLALRFVFALLGANPENGLASFIYGVTTPFVSPFFNLFGYNFASGASRFESYTLVAMAIYALVGYGLARLVRITRR